MKFTKMHGAGNDYIYVNCLKETLLNPDEVAKTVSDRHFGVGSDGLVLILPPTSPELADFRIRIFNADGTEDNMCGNAVRCVGKYVYDGRLTDKTVLTVETNSGLKTLTMTVDNSQVTSVEVDMGQPKLAAAEIPVMTDQEQFISQPVMVLGKQYDVTCVSMGNPHAVSFCDHVDILEMDKLGPHFEHHPLFPERVNMDFVEVIDDHTIKMRVWGRGSGEIFSSGTGACAGVVACVLNGKCPQDERITVLLRGGKLKVTYQSDGTVQMQGGATKVFEGEIRIR